MMGKDQAGKTGNFIMYVLPCILIAVSAMLISEVIAVCTKSTAHVSSSYNIPFWNLNTMCMLGPLVFAFMVLIDNEFEYVNLRLNGLLVTNTLGLTYLLATNPKVSFCLETFYKEV